MFERGDLLDVLSWSEVNGVYCAKNEVQPEVRRKLTYS